MGYIEIMQKYGNRQRSLLWERDRELLKSSKEVLKRITSQDPSLLGESFSELEGYPRLRNYLISASDRGDYSFIDCLTLKDFPDPEDSKIHPHDFRGVPELAKKLEKLEKILDDNIRSVTTKNFIRN